MNVTADWVCDGRSAPPSVPHHLLRRYLLLHKWNVATRSSFELWSAWMKASDAAKAVKVIPMLSEADARQVAVIVKKVGLNQSPDD